MNKNIGIIIGIILVITGGVYFFTKNTSNEAIMADKNTEKTSMMKDEVVNDTGMMDKGDTMMKVGSYEAYAPEKLARAETGDVVLFFHASWCPTCRGLSADIDKNIEAIPSEVSILKVDYDTESELKKKYGVTYQHTLVQVDKDGNMIKKWSGSPTLNSLVSQIN